MPTTPNNDNQRILDRLDRIVSLLADQNTKLDLLFHVTEQAAIETKRRQRTG
jgi:hypothetical protein